MRQRGKNYGEYCEDHKRKCEFDKCDKRINDYGNHCPQHPPQEQARLYREERNILQTQLNTANTNLTTANNQLNLKQQETEWLKNQLKMEMGDEEYQARVEANYPPQFRNN